MSPAFEILKARVGVAQDFGEYLLIGKAVVVVDEVGKQIVQFHVRLLHDHVAAGKTAQAAPVTRALVRHEDIAPAFPAHMPLKPPPITSTSVEYA